MDNQYYVLKTEDLMKKMHASEDENYKIVARNQIVQLNLPLVTTVLKKFGQFSDDQFQCGCIGLIKAVETYNITKEVPFSNYACFVIEREIYREFNLRNASFEGRNSNTLVYLDADTKLPNGDTIATGSLIEDVEATKYMEQFIEDNALQVMCDTIIKPAIDESCAKGQKSNTKIDFDVWKQLEFRYIMSIIFTESQKTGFNLTTMAKECNVSVQNIRIRHLKVMDLIFQRMWEHMTFTYADLLERIRGSKRIPKRLLCLDPGKTTGWCLFEEGKLARWGQIEDCYDDATNSIQISGLQSLMEEIEPDFVLYENYRIYSHKLERHEYSSVLTIRLLGFIETYCQLTNIKYHSQMASMAKNFCTDEKLKSWGFWKTGQRHSRDAIRHGCYFLLFYKKGEDIL